MKAVLAAMVLMSAISAQAMQCKFELNDLSAKPIVVTGNSKSELIEKGADKCFEMYQQRSIVKTGGELENDDAGVTIVNKCANICG